MYLLQVRVQIVGKATPSICQYFTWYYTFMKTGNRALAFPLLLTIE